MSVTINNLGLNGGKPFDVYIDRSTLTIKGAREAMFKLVEIQGKSTPQDPTVYFLDLYDADGEIVRYKVYENWGIKDTKLNEYKEYNIYQWLDIMVWSFQGTIYKNKPNPPRRLRHSKNYLLLERIVKFVESNSNLKTIAK